MTPRHRRRKPGVKINLDPQPVRDLGRRLADAQADLADATGQLLGDVQPAFFADLVVATVGAQGQAATIRSVHQALAARVPPGAQLLVNHVPLAIASVRQMAYRLQKDGRLHVVGDGPDAQLVGVE